MAKSLNEAELQSASGGTVDIISLPEDLKNKYGFGEDGKVLKVGVNVKDGNGADKQVYGYFPDSEKGKAAAEDFIKKTGTNRFASKLS